MRETIARYRDLLVAHLGVLEEEIRLSEARYREREGDFRYVTLENVAIIERQLNDVTHLKAKFEKMDIEQFDTIEGFKEFVLAGLQELYDSRAILRSGIRVVMECVRGI